MDNYNETVINYFNNESVMELVIDPEPDNTVTDTVTTTPVNTGTPVDTVGEGVGKVNSENKINIMTSYVDPITSLPMFEPVTSSNLDYSKSEDTVDYSKKEDTAEKGEEKSELENNENSETKIKHFILNVIVFHFTKRKVKMKKIINRKLRT